MKVSQGKFRKAIPEMFLTEIKYAADCLSTGLIKKNEIRNLELEINKKTEYER